MLTPDQISAGVMLLVAIGLPTIAAFIVAHFKYGRGE